MKAPSFKVIIPALLITLAACNNASQGPLSSNATAEQEVTTTDTVAMADAAGEAMPLNAPERKIIRTAAMRCRVRDVYAATAEAEHLVSAVGGQIAESNLENETTDTRSLPYSQDSLRQVQSYTTTAHLTLRIPVTRLDTVLKAFAANAAFIHKRKLVLDDVTFRYLNNQLKNKASDEQPIKKASALARKTGDVITTAQYSDEQNGRHIDRRMENMSILDQVNYATVQIDLYQPERIDQMIVPDMSILMKPSFGQQATIALSNSWAGMKAFFILLITIWPLLAVAVLVLLFIRHRKGKHLLPVLSK